MAKNKTVFEELAVCYYSYAKIWVQKRKWKRLAVFIIASYQKYELRVSALSVVTGTVKMCSSSDSEMNEQLVSYLKGY